jgi:hypothetical protein
MLSLCYNSNSWLKKLIDNLLGLFGAKEEKERIEERNMSFDWECIECNSSGSESP